MKRSTWIAIVAMLAAGVATWRWAATTDPWRDSSEAAIRADAVPGPIGGVSQHPAGPPGSRRAAFAGASGSPSRRDGGVAAVPPQRPRTMRVAPGDLPPRQRVEDDGAGIVPPLDADGHAAAALAERVQGLPEAKSRGEQPAAEKRPGDDPDLLLSLPLKGAIDTEAGIPPISADGVELQGDAVTFGDDAMMRFTADGNVNGTAGSIAFAITPTWAGADETNQSFVQVLSGDNVWENRLSLVKNFDALRFILIDDTGVERNVNVPIRDWAPGEAHSITATWGDALMALYVDGRLVGQNTYQGNLEIAPSGPIYLGYNQPGAQYAGVGGTVSGFKIYGRPLAADEVK